MVCCPTGTSGSNVHLLDDFRLIPRWMERDVLLDHLPMDLRHMALFQYHGVYLGLPHRDLLHLWRYLSLQLWQRFASLS